MAPTWIDEGMVREWQFGPATRYDLTLRWFVGLDERRTTFAVMSGNVSHGSFGGEDDCYAAEEVAFAIERWGTPTSGLEASPAFLDALKRNVQRMRAKGSRLEVIRAKYLFDAMQARIAVAEAEDQPPFPGHAQRGHADDDILTPPEKADDDTP